MELWSSGLPLPHVLPSWDIAAGTESTNQLLPDHPKTGTDYGLRMIIEAQKEMCMDLRTQKVMYPSEEVA